MRPAVVLHFLVILSVFHAIECKYGYAVWKKDKLFVKETDYYADIPTNHVARASFSNEINTTGWAFLELYTSEKSEDEKQAYAAGYLEGFLTRDLVWMHWQNMLKGYCYNKTDICGLIEEYVDKNEEYITKMVNANPHDPYWYQVKLYYIQIEGLAVGYNAATKAPYHWLTTRDIIWINMLGDLDELAFALSMPNFTDGMLFADHCTGLVKLLPDWTNLYTSQVTWNRCLTFRPGYTGRGHKLTSESACDHGLCNQVETSSTYKSTDDFYILSSGLVCGETTIGNSNRTLFEMYVKPYGSIMEYARTMVANRLARSGQEWRDLFVRHNSGTYNNQWYVVDYNKYKAKTPRTPGSIKAGLLWVIEQLPGYTESADMTQHLIKTTYFASYNIPFFPRIFNLSGGQVRISTYGDWFGYNTNPRAKIFQERQGNVHNLRDMYFLMRYNDYKHDPLSRCEKCSPPYSACNAISARNDLNPANGTYPFRALGHRSHGATDVKITSAYLRRSYRFLAISSPTHNISRGIPPFQWSKFDLGKSIQHIGHPDIWAFHPILHDWEWE